VGKALGNCRGVQKRQKAKRGENRSGKKRGPTDHVVEETRRRLFEPGLSRKKERSEKGVEEKKARLRPRVTGYHPLNHRWGREREKPLAREGIAI